MLSGTNMEMKFFVQMKILASISFMFDCLMRITSQLVMSMVTKYG